MRIAVNTRFLLSNKMEGFGWFTFETVKRMVEAHPEHEFYFYFDRPYDERFIFAENVKGFVLNPQARHPVLFKWWFNVSVTKALARHKPDVFFSPDGYLSMKTVIPQVGVIHDLNFEHYPEDLPKSARNYLRKFFPQFAHKADHIITVSEYSKQDIVETYSIDPKKITVAHNGGSEKFVPLKEEDKIACQEQFGKGEEYFVFVGALHPRKNVKRLFDAFEKFKYDSGSKTKLVIVGEKLWRDRSLESAFKINTAKDDISFTGHLDMTNLTRVVGGAKALVFPSYFEGFGIPLIEAMRAGCPILCGNKTALPEVAGEAAILFDPFSVDEMAEAMFEMDSNIELRNNLISKGLDRYKQFSWDFTAQKIWNVLSKYGS